MDKQLKAKWVEALRSGRYQQVQFSLKDRVNGKPAYCCLGVLRQLMHPGSTAAWGAETGYLCREHMVEAGLTFQRQQGLAKMNDNGKTFEQIADHIEKKL